MVRELGLDLKINELFFIRKAAVEHLSNKLDKRASEIPYRIQIKEIFNRLLNHDLSGHWSFDEFLEYSKAADLVSETEVQYVNKDVKSALSRLREKGCRLYLVTDFYLSKELILEILTYHGLNDLFDGVYVSSSYEASKENGGSLYSRILKELKLDPGKVVMIGDNKRSDINNANKHGIKGIFIGKRHLKLKNKFKLLGNDKNEYVKINKALEARSIRSSHAYGEYIILFHIFMERLYKEAKKKRIKNLFFISREGFFLKRLFDHYQSTVQLNTGDTIRSHYFKASRQSTMQIAHKKIDIEGFEHLRRQDSEISMQNFMKAFLFSDALIDEITSEIGIDKTEMIPNFYNSDLLTKLRRNEKFVTHYERNRGVQKKAFQNYLDSFDIDFHEEGMTVVDVGWRGTMQECIYTFFNERVNVNGYYLGLKEGYRITESTKRFGLNFSVYPTASASDNVLMANRQLYEQLLAAPHGSTLGYRNKAGDFTIEHYEENEKRVYYKMIAPIQEYMFAEYCQLIEDLKPVCYEYDVVQEYMTDLALRLGLFAGKKKIKFMHEISQGFYQNVGNNEVGLNYDHSQLRDSKISVLKRFLWFPEKTFRFLVKIKPMLYAKGLYWLSYPVNLIYYYIKFINGIKGIFFKKKLLEY